MAMIYLQPKGAADSLVGASLFPVKTRFFYISPLRTGGHRRNFVVWTMFLYSKQQKSYHGILETLELTPIETLPGPYLGSYDFREYFRLCIPFLHFTLCGPFKHIETVFWSLWKTARAQGTLLDLH